MNRTFNSKIQLLLADKSTFLHLTHVKLANKEKQMEALALFTPKFKLSGLAGDLRDHDDAK